MKINNDYQKRRGQITSFPTEEIIDPNKKYLETTNFIHYQNFYRKSLERNKKNK